MAHRNLIQAAALALGLAAPAGAAEYLEVPSGSLLSIELVDPVHTGKNKTGETFRGRLLEGVFVRNRLAVAPGTTVRGELLEVRRSGRVKGRSKLSLTLRSLQIEGSTYALKTDALSYRGDKHTGKNIGSWLGGALQGALYGMIFGGGEGAGIGAGAGAAVGAAQGLIKGKQDLEFKQGARLLFELLEPVVVPVFPEPPAPAQPARSLGKPAS